MYDVEQIKVTPSQRELAAYIKKETGKSVKPESIALIDALRVAYRNDPERVSAAAARKAERDAKKRARLEKTLAQARKLAESLGVDFSAVEGLSAIHESEDEAEEGEVEPEVTLEESEPEEDEDFEEEEPEPEPEPVKPARKPASRKTSTGKKVAAVPSPKKESTPADVEPLSPDIDVIQEEDGWETTSSASADDDFFDDEDGEDY